MLVSLFSSRLEDLKQGVQEQALAVVHQAILERREPVGRGNLILSMNN